MAQLTGFPNLADRAARLLAERGRVPDDALAAALFGGPAPAWLRLLENVLTVDSRFERVERTWRLRSAEPGSATLGPAVALAVLANGPQPFRHLPVALAAIRFGSAGRAEWASLVRPERRVRLPDYLARHGVDVDSLEGAPTFSEIAPELLAFVDGYPLVGLDVTTAVAFLQFALRRAGLPELANPIVELAGQAAQLERGRKRPDIGRLARWFGVPVPIRRDVRSLALATAEIAQRALGGAAPDAALAPVGGAKRALRATENRPLHDLRTLESIPERPGVYQFLADGGEVLYVGKATNLRDRISSYVSADVHRTRQMAGLAELTARVEVTPLRSGIEAALLELREIRALTPRYNVQQGDGAALAYVCADLAAAADWRTPKLRVQSVPADTYCGPLPATEARRIISRHRARYAWPGGRKPHPVVAMQRMDLAQCIWREVAADVGRSILPAGLPPAEVEWCAICTVGYLGQPVAVLLGVAGYAGSVELDEPHLLARELEAARRAAARDVSGASLAELRLGLRLAERGGLPIVPWRGDAVRFARDVFEALKAKPAIEEFEA